MPSRLHRFLLATITLVFSKGAFGSCVTLFLGSGGFSKYPGGMEYLAAQLNAFLGPQVKRVLLIPYAEPNEEYRGPEATLARFNLIGGRTVDNLAFQDDAKKAIEEAQAFFAWGGNTYCLLDALYERTPTVDPNKRYLLHEIRERVLQGVPFVGISAGANIACPTIRTTNDWRVRDPASMNAMNVVPFQINPHFYFGDTFAYSEGGYVEVPGETRDERIAGFQHYHAVPTVGLTVASALLIHGRETRIVTLNPMANRYFPVDKAAIELPANEDIGPLLFDSQPGVGPR